MTTRYTQTELTALERMMLDRAPATPTAVDFEVAPSATGMTMAASDSGLLINLRFKVEQELLFYLNCVVALELMWGIYRAAIPNGWWKTEPEKVPASGIRIPTTDDFKTSLRVVALTTAADQDGILVNVSDGNASFIFYLPRPIAARIFLGINKAGGAADWWNESLVLKPIRETVS
jgi:hypothetical protein